MHSHSRARILFDAFCALAISASFAVAWMQTGSSALLSAAGIAALYGLVHAFDGRRAEPVEPAESQRIAFEETTLDEVPADGASDHVPTVHNPPVAVEPAMASEGVEPEVPQERESRAKARRKVGRRRTSTPKEAKVAEIVPPIAPVEDVESAFSVPIEEGAQPHIEPLFEPEPFVRMPRPAFGRKAG